MMYELRYNAKYAKGEIHKGEIIVYIHGFKGLGTLSDAK